MNPRSEHLYDDPALLGRLARRDPAAQQAVWERERPRLIVVAAAAGGSPADVDGIVADVFADFFFHYVDHLKHAAAVPAYLRIMAIRRAQRARDHALRQQALVEETLVQDDRERLERTIDEQAQLPRLAHCLEQLSPRSRAVLRLHYGQSVSYSSIGVAVGVTKQAVGKIVQRCLAALRRCLERGAQPAAARPNLTAPQT